jgi:hypothetical protein
LLKADIAEMDRCPSLVKKRGWEPIRAWSKTEMFVSSSTMENIFKKRIQTIKYSPLRDTI